MPETPFPDVFVKAVAITRGESILTIYNESWGAFTLPMSKSRSKEDPLDTAIRVTVEALGRPLGDDELPKRHVVHTLDPYNESGRDGVWKCYHVELFQLELEAGETPKPLGGVPTAWMTLEQMEKLKPVSETALMIARSMRAATFLPDGR